MAKKTKYKYMFRCGKCDALVDHMIEYATCISSSDVILSKKGEVGWSPAEANSEDGDFLKLECPECGEELDETDTYDLKKERVKVK